MTNLSEQEQQQQQAYIIACEAAKVKGEALERLRANPDFKLIIEEGYIKEQALRATNHSSYLYRWKTEDILEDIRSISNLRYYFDAIEHEADGARRDLIEYLNKGEENG